MVSADNLTVKTTREDVKILYELYTLSTCKEC